VLHPRQALYAYSLDTVDVSNIGDASLLTNYSGAMNVAIGRSPR
jgi:hypothetical protein